MVVLKQLNRQSTLCRSTMDSRIVEKYQLFKKFEVEKLLLPCVCMASAIIYYYCKPNLSFLTTCKAAPQAMV